MTLELMQLTAREHVEQLRREGRENGLARQAATSWRRRLAAALVGWAGRLEPEMTRASRLA